MTLFLTVCLKRRHSWRILTQFIKRWKHLLFTCFGTSLVGARTKKIHMIRKVAYTRTICVILGDRQRYLNTFLKIVSICPEQIRQLNLVGSNALKVFFATSATPQSSVCTIRISINGFTAIALAATKAKFVLSSTHNRNEITLKKYAKTTENKCKIKSIT